MSRGRERNEDSRPNAKGTYNAQHRAVGAMVVGRYKGYLMVFRGALWETLFISHSIKPSSINPHTLAWLSLEVDFLITAIKLDVQNGHARAQRLCLSTGREAVHTRRRRCIIIIIKKRSSHCLSRCGKRHAAPRLYTPSAAD